MALALRYEPYGARIFADAASLQNSGSPLLLSELRTRYPAAISRAAAAAEGTAAAGALRRAFLDAAP